MKNNNINGHAAQPYTRITETESQSWAASSLVGNQLAFVEVGHTLSIIAWEVGGGFKLRACPQQLDRATGVHIIPAYTQQLTAAFSATILAQPRMRSLDQVDSMALYMLHIAGAGEGSFASTVYLFRKTE